MSLFALVDATNVIQALVEWDGTSNPTQFGALTPVAIDPALDAQPGDTFAGGVLIHGTPLAVLHRQAIVARAQQALTANDTFLAIATPTQAQALTQVQLLTREVDGIIRLLLGQLDQTGDT